HLLAEAGEHQDHRPPDRDSDAQDHDRRGRGARDVPPARQGHATKRRDQGLEQVGEHERETDEDEDRAQRPQDEEETDPEGKEEIGAGRVPGARHARPRTMTMQAVWPWMKLRSPTGPISPAQKKPPKGTSPPSASWTGVTSPLASA